MEDVKCRLCFQEFRGLYISQLNVISKLFETIINKEVAYHFNKKNILSNKRYGFQSIADILTAIPQRISETRDSKYDDRIRYFKDVV